MHSSLSRSYRGTNMKNTHTGWAATALLLCWTLAFNGCAIRVGPKTVRRDRFDYAGAISESWKQQMLMNMVRMRYLDSPMFLEIAQVVASYTFEASGSVGGTGWNGTSSDFVGAASGRWAESPTITYNPLFGEKFTKDLLQAIPPATLLSLVQSGWPADAVLYVGARSINGIKSGTRINLIRQSEDPRYQELLTLLTLQQQSGHFGLRVEAKEGGLGGIITLQRGEMDDEASRRSDAIRAILKLDPTVDEFRLAYGSMARDNREIAILTRSMLEILAEAASGVEVPASHVSEGRVLPNARQVESQAAAKFAVNVRCSAQRPPAGDAFVSVKYRDHWFWVDDKDVRAKRGLGFLMILFTLAESSGAATPPVLTIAKP